ncbi:ABC transporter ATP-binding protein [Pseudoponticoccus marisrubri]|uniref:ABC transporter ATP-binding protein n=1 Tax=Pseudoponticoccus marisrubri TaxID=1685382 RepID=A0A0W7WIH5_9RHOB|nr:ABC transporter ATP-binding protein [Pseudoponticoccus marisrubri]KUF10350.1 ABC transporter ATP-binding protein [Pseudoponticoccus marisrubri]
MSERPRLFAWLWRGYLRRYAGLMVLAMVFMAIEGAMFGGLSYMMKPMFDQVFVGGDRDALVWVGLVVLGIFVTRAVASVVQKVLLTRVSQMSMGDIRLDLLTHLMSLDQEFHQQHGPGYLIQRVEGDVNAIAKVWNTLITGAGRDVVALVSLFGVALSIDWRWTLVALVGAPLLVGPSVLLQRFVRGNAREVRDIAARLSTRLNEVFHGIVPVKLNGLERYQAEKYRALTRARIRAETRSAAGQASLPGLIDLMSGIGFVGVLYYGGSEILSGQKTVGDFMAFFTAIGLAFEPLRRLGAVSGVWQVAAASIERIKELLETVPRLRDPATPLAVPDHVPDVRLEDVRLCFGGTEVLRGLSFTAAAGKTTALVGASGAGKSTVFNLLTRLVDPQMGRVMIGDVLVEELRLTDLRGLISVVSQESLLFDESLRENIVLDQVIDSAALDSAMNAAHVTDFLPRLEHGLDSPAGPRGSNLSGGQRQRVAIARALLRDTPVLLLDEATSALDAQSEAVVQEALERLAQGRTTLVIAHRLSTVRNADHIVVMDHGRVVDEGTHEQLIARPGPYAELYRLQFDTAQGGGDGPGA